MKAEATFHCRETLRWVKSSRSDNAGGMCVEVAWTKSSHSDNEGGNCLEFAHCCGAVHVRDSKNKRGARLALSREQWAAFVDFAVR